VYIFFTGLVHVWAIFSCHLQGAYTKISLQPTAINKVTINIHTKHMASCVHNFSGLQVWLKIVFWVVMLLDCAMPYVSEQCAASIFMTAKSHPG
jgi:hypothetical protein